MGVERRLDVPVYDLSVVKGLWEGRVKKQRLRQKKEKERIEQSALARIDQQWQYRIYCKTLRSHDRTALHQYLTTPTAPEPGHAHIHTDGEEPDPSDPQTDPEKLVFRLEGDKWMSFPKELQWMTYLKEWYVSHTRIQRLPEFLAQFSKLQILDLSMNQVCEIPPEIAKLSSLMELNLSYNRLMKVPPELGECEELRRLELAGNRLCELPFELSSLKQLILLDLSENFLLSVPICVLRMDALQILNLSNNRLKDLPQDMDRLEKLESLYLHKNSLTYLPQCLALIAGLKMVIVSADTINCVPTKLCSSPDIKYIRLHDTPTVQQKQKKEEEQRKREAQRRTWRGAEDQDRDNSEREFLQAYVSSLANRESAPYSTTKISISCQL